MNDFAFLLFTVQKYSSFNPPYFLKRTLKFFLNSIPACSVYEEDLSVQSKNFRHTQLAKMDFKKTKSNFVETKTVSCCVHTRQQLDKFVHLSAMHHVHTTE